MKKENVHIVFVKPVHNIQQCLSVYSIHKSDNGAIESAKNFHLTYPEGYSEIQVFTLRK